MKRGILTSIFLLAGLATLGNNIASASDEFAGAVLGAGTGAVLGHVVGGRDAAVVGGIIGAMIGVAAADGDDRYVARRHYRSRAPHPVVIYSPPRVRYAPPVWVTHRHERRDWHHEGRDWRYEGRDWRHDRHDFRERAYPGRRDPRDW